jgi:hypothetical protein
MPNSNPKSAFRIPKSGCPVATAPGLTAARTSHIYSNRIVIKLAKISITVPQILDPNIFILGVLIVVVICDRNGDRRLPERVADNRQTAGFRQVSAFARSADSMLFCNASSTASEIGKIPSEFAAHCNRRTCE